MGQGGGVLFAITSSSQCAELLPFGDYGSLSATSATGFCTNCCMDPHSQWRQEFYCADDLQFTITYDFTSGDKTISDRVLDATSSGEPTDFTVVTAEGASHSKSGTW